MPFKKGKSGNVLGKPKGLVNATTKVQREYIQLLVDGQQDKIKRELSKLEGEKYINAMLGLLEFVIPKLQRTEITGNIELKSIIGMIIK